MFAFADATMQDNKTARFSILTLFHSIAFFFAQKKAPLSSLWR